MSEILDPESSQIPDPVLTGEGFVPDQWYDPALSGQAPDQMAGYEHAQLIRAQQALLGKFATATGISISSVAAISHVFHESPISGNIPLDVIAGLQALLALEAVRRGIKSARELVRLRRQPPDSLTVTPDAWESETWDFPDNNEDI